MLGSLESAVHGGVFVYAAVADELVASLSCEATVREPEGMTVVLRREDADVAGLACDFVASWASLTVNSALNAGGLTAAFATALDAAGISCNMLAGAHHDHILVPVPRTDIALRVRHELGVLTARCGRTARS
ncbi:MAG: ACT domain-containing protein [Microbacteriaceae bacterium]|nr:ACT domain-containing protein [Microbacteriaceae bacterium]